LGSFNKKLIGALCNKENPAAKAGTWGHPTAMFQDSELNWIDKTTAEKEKKKVQKEK